MLWNQQTILDLSKCEKEWNDIWDVHFGIWRSYAKEAFKKPQAFEAVFYRNINRDLGEALKEYYEMFPDAIIQVSPFIKEMLEIPSYYQRDYYICKLLVAEGKISEENAKKLNHIICTLFLGYFKFVQEHGVEPEAIPELVEAVKKAFWRTIARPNSQISRGGRYYGNCKQKKCTTHFEHDNRYAIARQREYCLYSLQR